jgi:hypothetical protein
MRTGVLSDESVRRFCRTIERDESTGPLARRLLATRSSRFDFTKRLAEATYTPEQLAVASPAMYIAMFQRAAHILTAPEGEEWAGYGEEAGPGEGSDDEGEGEEGEEEYDFSAPQATPLDPPMTPAREAGPSSSTTPLARAPPRVRTSRDIRAAASRSRQARMTRSTMKAMTRAELEQIYRDAYAIKYGVDPGNLDKESAEQLADDFLSEL